MKKILVIMGLVLIALVGCSGRSGEQNKERDDGNPKISEEKVDEEIQQFLVDRDAFHFLVGWLSNEAVLFVDKEADNYRLKSFNIYSKEIKTVYEEEHIIADVFIHPTKEALLVHTTALNESATVKMVTLDGVVHNEITLESAELAIEWNDLNRSYLLVTAFYEDWSYDTFFFDCSSNELTLLSIDTPFPKWFGTDQFLFKDSLNNDEMAIYNIETSKQTKFKEKDVVFYDTFKDSLLMAQETADEQMRYTILNNGGEVAAQWTRAADENTMLQTMPYVEWLGEDSVLILYPEDGNQQVEPMYELVRYDGDDKKVVMGDLLNAKFICSPDEEKCITGYGLENMLMLEEKTAMPWLKYIEE